MDALLAGRATSVDLQALADRAAEVHETLAWGHRTGDVVGVADQVRRLGLALERAQRR